MHSQLRIQEISALLPHRYPFLLVDRVLSIEQGVGIKSVKNVTINEPFFQGHFPGEPIMPGVLILEAMAQTGIIFAKNTDPEGLGDKLMVFAGMDGVRFRRQVVPGDQLIIDLKLIKRKSIIWKMEGRASVDGKVVAEAKLIAAVQ
ncbi:MAG: 3-hydroxyacyl-ACP dehydratase FabZ [Deltaproteobacteria bacterium]|nr:3-hydroxyacyl-ACP dehydratase FabZ [Deltaproteobacteria bacterium]